MATKTTRELLSGYADDVKQAMQTWQVPGCAIGIVQQGKTIFAKGFGRRDVQNKSPVTPDTIFAIGSCTKAFTCAALGILADEGKLDWDKPVREYMPDFRMFDPVATEHMTARDLVTHRSGLPRHDMLWYGSSLSRSEMFARLRHLEPSKDIRAVFQYNNLMYLAAGMLIERIAGMSWEEFMQARLLTPLGMTRTNLSVTTSQTLDDFAKPYHKHKNDITEVPFHNIDAIGPAGAINSSINDLTQWLKLNLNKGKRGDAQVISEAMLNDIFAPHMVMAGAPASDPEIGQSAYSLGWMVTAYRGHVMLQHGGGIDGFISLVTLMPNDGVGIVALTNLDASPLTSYITFNALDRLLKLKPAPWMKRMQENEAKMKAAAAEAEAKKASPKHTSPIRTLEEYAGEYEHAGYGRARLSVEAEQLHLHYNSFDVPLTHVKGDAFEGNLEMLDLYFKFAFGSDLEGNINTVSLVMDPSIKPIVFSRIAGEALRDKTVLEKLAGKYDLMGTPVNVALQGEDRLVATIPGQPRYTLVPAADHRFNLKELAGFSVEFTLDEAGAVQGIIFHQPNGDFAGKRIV